MNPLLGMKLADFALDTGKSLIDRLFPDKEKQASERAVAEAHLMQMKEDSAIRRTAQQLSAIIAEAQSEDPWTSRARPSFLYVMYIMILSALPMGILSAFSPQTAANIAAGMKLWLGAIPPELWMLFGTGYLGYTGAREFGKFRRAKALAQ